METVPLVPVTSVAPAVQTAPVVTQPQAAYFAYAQPAVQAAPVQAAPVQAASVLATGISIRIGWFTGLAILFLLIILIILSIYGVATWLQRSTRESERIKIDIELDSKRKELLRLQRDIDDADTDF